jgi:HD-GYP domain-containing protein (c-di-GMP phosphodiesterase class II)
MIKLIPTASLRVGMYIHDLNCDWMSHPFMRTRLKLRTDAEIEKILGTGIQEVYIDTDRGLDADDAPTVEEVREQVKADMLRDATRPVEARITVAEEMDRAAAVHKQAHKVVREVMQDVRLGKAVQLERMEPLVESITGSILRNQGALLSMLDLKSADEYTFLHCVSVCTLMVAFCRSLGISPEETRQAGLGGLLHDVGKMKIPLSILNKPGRLTEEEFDVMRRHPGEGHALLVEVPTIGPVPLDITLNHHERMDGSGYPGRLKPDAITRLARMAAIVDVYDAITSDRCYHRGMPPAEAVAKLYEWSRHHFDPVLVQAFLRCIGIYPVGTLVRLQSGRLAVVQEQNPTSLLTPVVKVIFSTRQNVFITPEVVDLARGMGAGGADAIVAHESPERWGIEPRRFL